MAAVCCGPVSPLHLGSLLLLVIPQHLCFCKCFAECGSELFCSCLYGGSVSGNVSLSGWIQKFLSQVNCSEEKEKKPIAWTGMPQAPAKHRGCCWVFILQSCVVRPCSELLSHKCHCRKNRKSHSSCGAFVSTDFVLQPEPRPKC